MTEQELRAAADAVMVKSMAELKALGVQSVAVAIVLPDSVPAEKRIATLFDGTAGDIINLVGSLAMQMMPQDYAVLFNEMHSNPLFLRLLHANTTEVPTNPQRLN